MAVTLLDKNYKTKYCEFSYDNWETDGFKLPALDKPGQDSLSTLDSCCQGSIAIGTDGGFKILSGNNEWIDY